MKIRLRRILVPVFLCLAVACLIEIPMGQTDLFGDEAVLWDTLFRAIAAMPGLLYFYREDAPFRGDERFGVREAVLFGAAGFLFSAASRVILAAIGGLGYSGAGAAVGGLGNSGAETGVGGLDYAGAEAALFAGRFWLQALVLLLASPLLEEFFFRGVLYQRLKELLSPAASAVVSAALFGLYHGNLSQGIYGFFMGLFLAYAMERCQTVKAPVLVHFSANLAAIAASALNLP